MIKKNETRFCDGLAVFYETKEIAEPGKLPKKEKVFKRSLRYEERIVGAKRFYTAMQNNTRLDMVIRCYKQGDITLEDIAEIKDGFYKIVQIQYQQEKAFLCMDISLERLVQPHE